jgi:hypothetical protein
VPCEAQICKCLGNADYGSQIESASRVTARYEALLLNAFTRGSVRSRPTDRNVKIQARDKDPVGIDIMANGDTTVVYFIHATKEDPDITGAHLIPGLGGR